MERVPYSKYTKELRLEAVRLVSEGGLSAGEAATRLSLPKSTLENWVRAFREGRLESIGSSHRPLTEVEIELSRVKRELALVRMERDILKKAAVYLPRSRCTARGDGADATRLSAGGAVPDNGSVGLRFLCQLFPWSFAAGAGRGTIGNRDPGRAPAHAGDLRT